MTGPSTAEQQAAALTEELQQLVTDLIFTEKAHFAAAHRHGRLHRVLGVIATVAGAVAAEGIVSDRAPAWAASFALLASIASGVLTFVKPQEASQKHLDAGRDLGGLRVQVRQTLKLDVPVAGPAELAAARQAAERYAKTKAAIDKAAPAITDEAYKRGRAKIVAGEFEVLRAPRHGMRGRTGCMCWLRESHVTSPESRAMDNRVGGSPRFRGGCQRRDREGRTRNWGQPQALAEPVLVAV